MNYRHSIDGHGNRCACAQCCRVALDETLDAAGIADPATLVDDIPASFDEEYALYQAAHANIKAGVVRTPGAFTWETKPVPRERFQLEGWLQCDGRRVQLAWQANESRRIRLELAREEGRQDGAQSTQDGAGEASTPSLVYYEAETSGRTSAPENGLSGAPDLCGCSPTRDEIMAETGFDYADEETDASGWASRMFAESEEFRDAAAVVNDYAAKGKAWAFADDPRYNPSSMQLGTDFDADAARASDQAKGINPKQRYGDAKTPFGVVPWGAVVQVAPVFKVGADKYGPLNWRELKVQRVTYLAAALRHILSDMEGETIDPVENGGSGLPHLAHAIASLMIILDAQACGTLVDDRPAHGVAGTLMAAQAKGAL